MQCEECGKKIAGSQYYKNFMGQYFCRGCTKNLRRRYDEKRT